MRTRFVALLRGINVGRAKRVAMADLRAIVEGLGYGDPRTLLNSGNLVFTAPGSAVKDAGARIEKALVAGTGVSSRVIVLTAQELAVAVAKNPLSKVAVDPSRMFVAVLARPADRSRLVPLLEKQWTPEAMAIGVRVAYVWCPGGSIDSPLFGAVGRMLGDAVTTRNWATMTKLRALAEDST